MRNMFVLDEMERKKRSFYSRSIDDTVLTTSGYRKTLHIKYNQYNKLHRFKYVPRLMMSAESDGDQPKYRYVICVRILLFLDLTFYSCVKQLWACKNNCRTAFSPAVLLHR